jgi:hypothetical protein
MSRRENVFHLFPMDFHLVEKHFPHPEGYRGEDVKEFLRHNM